MPEKKNRYRAEVGMRLRLMREALGLDQEELADILGVGANAVSQYEGGKRGIDPELAAKLKQAKAVTLDWIYAGDPSGLGEKLFKAATRPVAVRAAGASKRKVA